MANIQPPSGPAGNDPWQINTSINTKNGSFNPMQELQRSLPALHASAMGNTLSLILDRPPVDTHAHRILITIASTFGGALRLATAPQILHSQVARFSQQLELLAYAGTNQPQIGRIAVTIKETLDHIGRRPGLLDDGAAFALAHTHLFAEELRKPRTLDLSGAPAPAIPLLLRHTLTLARNLIIPGTRDIGSDPAIALTLQGMAGTLLGVVARVPADGSQTTLLHTLRGVLECIDQASGGPGTNPALSQAQRCNRVTAQVNAIVPQLDPARNTDKALQIDLHSGVRSLVADGQALQTALAAQGGQPGHPFQN